MQEPLHEAIFQALRHRLASGHYAPGESLSLRVLAGDLGASVTPVRDAVWRLAAAQAVVVGPTRRISVPILDLAAVEELMLARALLEPVLGEHALPRVTPAILAGMINANAQMNAALRAGDLGGYMTGNHAFHFTLYRASGSLVLLDMIEAVWIRFGPAMRLMFEDAASTLDMRDRHADALQAIEAGDAGRLRRAITADVEDGRAWMVGRISARGR
jgi:DNA-binding GntR family transcriptional regulator